MIRAVLDTNVVFSALSSRGSRPEQVLRAAILGNYQMVLSQPLLDEYRRILLGTNFRRANTGADALRAAEEMLIAFQMMASMVVVSRVPRIVPDDPKDDIVVATAFIGCAHYIVSGDQHLTKMENYEDIAVVGPAKFLDIIAA